MGTDDGGTGSKPTERERDIAERRDALLSNARGENARGSGPDPRLMGLGLQFVVAILLCLYGGMWLDAKFHTAPWLMLAGAIVGASAGFYSMFRVLMSEDRRMDAEKRDAGNQKPKDR